MDAGGQPMSSAAGDDSEPMPLPHDPQTVFLGGLFLLACLTAMYAARDVVLPLVMAITLKLLLQPLVRQMERIRIPRAVGALVSIALLVSVLAVLGAILSSPASKLISNFSETLTTLQNSIAPLQRLIARFQNTLAQLGVHAEAAANPAQTITNNAGSIAGAVASGASGIASHLLETLLILFYLLVFGETFLRRLVEVLPGFSEKRQAVDISNTVEHDISVYLVTISVINAVVGAACAVVMWLFGVPGPLLWGVVAFCLNFIPILGPIIGVGLFAMIGLATLGANWLSLAPAACYLAIHLTEGEVVTPMLLAKRFTLNPIAIIVGLVFWYWMWGVPGAILSVPLLAMTKIVCERITSLRAVGHLLAG